ncbi:MAG: phosphonate ABC transporter ATP-binding protein [Armatimonadia bacterium]|nr:phosphonate ABC transporter ATP-binding protein [Armatimonadia bacterium]
MLTIENLSKVYDDGTRALSGINLEIDRGEFVVLIGLSGSGKSTLLRCINRLIDPTEGRILFESEDVTRARGAELRRIRRRMGMIFQQFNLVERSSVLRNVLAGRLGYEGAPLSLLGLWPRATVGMARECLERVGIEEKAQSRASALSGGQQQRVAIARALMQEPSLILADEPVASLDPATSDSVMRYLGELNRDMGLTIICSLHFLSLARKYGSRIIALKDGRMEFDGLPAEIDGTRFKQIYGEDAVEVEIR